MSARWFGGELELDPTVLLGRGGADGPRGSGTGQWVATGRTALALVARAALSHNIRTALLPAYLCPSVVQPFREAGLAVRYYRVSPALVPDANHVAELVSALRPAVVLVINYFGFPADREILTAARQGGGDNWIVEDCAHGSLIESAQPVVGLIGDFVLTSFRKYLPVPDGGLLLNRTDVTLPALTASDSRFTRYRLLGKLLRHERLSMEADEQDLEATYLRLFDAAERAWDMETPMEEMSLVSQRVFGQFDLQAVMCRRRENFTVAAEAFAADPGLAKIGTPLFSSLPQGVSPLAFPIRVARGRRDLLRSALAARRVFCPVHWPLPANVSPDVFPDACNLAEAILSLPIDQRYDAEDVGALLDRVRHADQLCEPASV